MCVCVFRCATSLFTWGFPRHRTPDVSQHCTLHCSLLRGSKAVSLALGSISLCLQPATGSPAQQGSARHGPKIFLSLEVTAVSGGMFLHCLHKIKSPKDLHLQKHTVKKDFSDTSNLSSLVGAYVHSWGFVLLFPMGFMASTEAVPVPSVCLGLCLAVTITQNSMSGLVVLSKAFSRHSPAIGLNQPKPTFPPKGMALSSSNPAVISQFLPTFAAEPAAHREWELGADGAESKKGKRSSLTRSARHSVPPCGWQELMAGRSGHSH